LVLAKIVRNNDRDRADVAAIAGGPGLDIDVLRARYVDELRPKLGRPEREDLTLDLWIEIIKETGSASEVEIRSPGTALSVRRNRSADTGH
jgi:hypothetical protein